MTQNLQWLESLGGPWLLTPLSTADRWMGNSALNMLTNGNSDYEALCARLMDETGTGTYLAAVGPLRNSLGIGEMAYGMTILEVLPFGPSLVEWFGADSDHQLAQRLSAASDCSRLTQCEIDITETEYVLFDSVWAYSGAPEKQKIHFQPARYVAETYMTRTGSDEFAVTRFTPHG